MVRRFTRSLAGMIVIGSLLALSLQSAFADQRDFTLMNGSPITIANLYVGPVDSSDWGSDILGRDVLDSGESVDIVFDGDSAGDCAYDIMVRGQGGEEGYLYKVDLCSVSLVTFS